MHYIILSAVISYLFGSVNFAILISEKTFNSDIRNHGSKNAGATNVFRTFGKKAGTAVFALDFLKGFVAVIIARLFVAFFDAPYVCILTAGFFSQLGHIFPLFYKFKGGKGVATAAGAAMAIMPIVASFLLMTFAVIVLLTKTVSLASGICAAIYPLLAYFISSENAVYNFIFAASCAVLILLKHISNIGRLLDGKENKI